MRSLVLSPWPSATKMSPFGATRTSDGRIELVGTVAGDAGLAERHQHPSVRGELASTVSPLPLPAWPSVTQTLPSRSANRPCGQLNRPEPKLTTSRPVASNFWIGATFEPSQVFAAAAIEHPDAGAVAVDIDADRHAPEPALRKLRPVLDDVVRIGRAVGIVRLDPSAASSQRPRRRPRRRAATHSVTLASSRMSIPPLDLCLRLCGVCALHTRSSIASVRHFAACRKQRGGRGLSRHWIVIQTADCDTK